MPKEAVFTRKLESSLQQGYMAVTKADRPTSQVMRELIPEYIQREHEKQDYEAVLARKVEQGRDNIRTDQVVDNDEVDKLFAERRARLAGNK